MANASLRLPAVAGQFYPADPRVLRLQIDDLLAAAHAAEPPAAPPKALLVPHAGYIYSGPVAAAGYAALRPLRDSVRKVVLLGPAHRVSVRGAALPAALCFATPLGEVAVEREDWVHLQHAPGVTVSDAAHAFEHALEVQLPFLQAVLEHFTIVPLLVGGLEASLLAALIDSLWGGAETLIVVSSDLSHYLPYEQARWLDRGTCEQILELKPGLDHQQACGASPVNGFLVAATRRHLRAQLLDLRNSGDTAGPRDRVVGYASIAFCEPTDATAH